MRVFISYGHDEHAELAMQIKRDLEARGHQTWFDLDHLKAGLDWESYIAEGLDWVAAAPGNGRVLLLMTPHSVRRPDGFCLNEIARAMARRLRIVPIMVVWCEPPLSICRIQWLDMRECVPLNYHREHYATRRDQLFKALEQDAWDFGDEQATLRHYLEPLDFSVEISEHVQGFIGRRAVLARIQEWMESEEGSRLFWITGPPGIGKTALAAHLCHTMSVGGFHLCRHGHDDKASPLRCVLSLAYQLSSQLPDYAERLLALDLVVEVKKSASTAFDNLLVQPLAGLSKPPQPLLLVLDALDEAQNGGENELARFLSRQFVRTPGWLRLLITSRPEPELAKHFQDLCPFELEPWSRDNYDDLRLFLMARFAEISHTPIPTSVVDLVLERSEGSFLYVRELIKELQAGRVTLSGINHFPHGLSKTYLSFFERRFPDINEYCMIYRPLFEMVSAARGALPLALARRALGWSSYDLYEREDGSPGGTIIERAGALLIHRDGTTQPFHYSVIEWLAQRSAGRYHVDLAEGQKRLAQVCWEEFQGMPGSMSAYALEHLSTHLLETGRLDNLLSFILSPLPGMLNRWTQGVRSDIGITCLERLIKELETTRGLTEVTCGLATQLARIFSLRGEYVLAEQWLEHACSGTRWWRGRRVRAVALHELGSLAFYRHDFAAARRRYFRALSLCLLGPRFHLDEAAGNLSGLATIAYATSRFKVALRYVRWGLLAAQRIGDIPHIVALERLRGAALKSLGRLDESETQLRIALRRAEDLHMSVEQGRIMLLLGWLEHHRAMLSERPYHEAKHWFEKALCMTREVHDSYAMFEAELSLIFCALADGETEGIASRLARLTPWLSTKTHPEVKAALELASARLAHRLGQFESARHQYETIIAYARQNSLRYGLRTALLGMGSTLYHAGQSTAAESAWREALQVAQSESSFKRQLTEIGISRLKADPLIAPLY